MCFHFQPNSLHFTTLITYTANLDVLRLVLLKSVSICFTAVISEDIITPFTDSVLASEGKPVTLSCNYSAGDTLQWYRQYPKSFPYLLIMEFRETAMKNKFTLDHKKNIKRTDLIISSAEVTDSAVYYCALRSTVTGNLETLCKNLIVSI